MMSSFFKLIIIMLICVNLSFSFACDDSYYAHVAQVVTLAGIDVNSLSPVSIVSVERPYDEIPHLDSLLTYKIPISMTSSCKGPDGFPNVKTQVEYLQRDGTDMTAFKEISQDMLVMYYDEVNLGANPLKDAIFIKPDTNINATEYLILDTLFSGKYTAFFGAAIMRDTLRSGSGSFKGYASGAMPWFISIGSSQFLASISEQWGDGPCSHPQWCDDQTDVASRIITVQLVTVYYDTLDVTGMEKDVKAAPRKSVNIGRNGSDIIFKLLDTGLSDGKETLKIFALNGKLVREISSANGEFEWDGRSDRRSPVPSGVYLFQVRDYVGKIYYSLQK
jgi:hypothetical protein